MFSDHVCVCVGGGAGLLGVESSKERKEGRKEQKAAVLCVWGFFYESAVSFQDFIYGVVKVAIIHKII